jgi:hypothetical protein
MSLSDAVEAVRKIESQYRSAPIDRTDGAKILGYSSLSGPANKALAALAHYGLVERAGKGEMRVTNRARAILHPASQQEKTENLRWAAMEPNLFRELQERFPDMTPPEDGVVTYLNRQGFNKSAIRPAVKAYLETLRFLQDAGVTESHRGGGEPDESSRTAGNEFDEVYGGALVGDLVDYEVGGALANSEPLRVRALSSDGNWVFVDGSETGLEMNQIIVRQRASADTDVERPTLPFENKREEIPQGMRKAMFPLDEGDVTLIFPEGLSSDSLTDLGAYLDIFLKKEIKKSNQS